VIDLVAYNGNSLLLNFLNSRPQYMLLAELYSISLRPGLYAPAGATLRWTSSLFAVSLGGHVWSPGPPHFKRPALRCESGLQASDATVTVECDDSALLAGVPLLARIARHEWDFATVKIERAFSAGPGQPWLGRAPRFLGQILDIQNIGRISADLNVKPMVHLLDRNWPMDTIMSTCTKVIYSTDCGAVAATFTTAGVVGSGTVNGFTTSLTAADDYYGGGTITFTGGVLAGLTYWVRSYLHAGGKVALQTPALVAPGAGDTFTIMPTCHQDLALCGSRFSNSANWGGFEFVPQPTTAY
jgi:uncharacterized phage protein (TIGR02218 family)